MEEEQAFCHSFCGLYDTMECLNYLQPHFALQSKLPIYDIGVTLLEHICGYVKISLMRSSCGGINIQIGDDAIHVPKRNSAHHLLTQMVLFANEIGNKLRCPKSLALESIISMVARSLRSHFNTKDRLPYSSGSSNVYESGWTPAKAHVESCHAGRIISVTPRAGDNCFILDSVAYCSAKTYSDTLPQPPHCQGNSKIFTLLQDMLTACNSVTQVQVRRPIFPSLKEGGFLHLRFPGISFRSMVRFSMLSLATSHVSDYLRRPLIMVERCLRLLSSAPSGHVGFSVTTSSKGGVNVNVGSHTIHVPKYFSVRHPLLQMVLFASKWCGDKFACPKSLAPKSIVDMARAPCSSPATNAYEAGWVSAKPRSVLPNVVAVSVLNPKERTGPGNEPVLPVLFDTSISKETISTVAAMPRPGDDGFAPDSRKYSTRRTKLSNMACVATMMNTENVPTIAGSLICGTDFRSTLHEQLVVNCPGDDHGINNPHSNGASAITSAEATLVPMVHELGDTEVAYHSDPDSLDAERVTVKTEEAKLSATWVLATAAPHHATGNRTLITGFAPQQDDIFVHAADGAPMPVLGCGSVVTDDLVLPDVWYVPGLTTNLVSVSQLSELDLNVEFGRAACCVRSAADGAIVGEARTGEGGLFEVDFLKVPLAV